MKSWSKKNSDPTRRVGSVTVVNVLQTIRVEVYYFPFDWCIGEAFAKLTEEITYFGFEGSYSPGREVD